MATLKWVNIGLGNALLPSHDLKQCWFTISLWHLNMEVFSWKIKNCIYMGNGSTKQPSQLKNYLRSGDKILNKLKYVCGNINQRYYQCIFHRIRKLFSGDVIPLCLLEICTFDITATSPRVKLLDAIDTQMFTLPAIARANVDPGLCCH